MSKNQNKTKPIKISASQFVNGIENPTSRKEAKILMNLFKDTTKSKPVMWGNMIGFGSYHYNYDSGREGDFFATGFAMRKSGPTIYIMPGYVNYSNLLKDLGPHKLGKSCLYLKNLEGIDLTVLKKL
ncbi:DUF1801 domain-containing protein, partial [Candidatus Kaiserbacteria bacterium]|nr:DUF1801 domain-containing protein [Candidatus Kaiserbacteria bacterium]